MQIRLEAEVRLPDGRTRAAMLALMAFATICDIDFRVVCVSAGRP